MTKQTRRKFSAKFKAKVALEAIKNQKTMSQLSMRFDVNAITISKWKTEALEHLPMAFKSGQSAGEFESSIEAEKLYAQIGHLKVENDFLKKCAEIGNQQQRMEMINPDHKKLSVRKQCEIQAVPRSSLYYQPIPEKPENVKMMNLMDEHFLGNPPEGVVSMLDWLK